MGEGRDFYPEYTEKYDILDLPLYGDEPMNITSLSYTRSAKITDPNNRFENHDVSVTATVSVEGNDDHAANETMEELRKWVLDNVRKDVVSIRDVA